MEQVVIPTGSTILYTWGGGRYIAVTEQLTAKSQHPLPHPMHLSCSFFLYRALKSSQRSLCSMMIVDSPGFQNPEMAGQSRGATFEELCHNYAQERLQTLFHECTFLQELERYKEVLGRVLGSR